MEKMKRSRKSRNIGIALRVVLSLFLVFHLFAIILAPNRESHLTTWSAPVIEPYLDVLSLSATWNFFAPDPGPPPIFLEWELLDQKGGPVELGRVPAQQSPYFLRERQNRRLVSTRFMIFSNDRIEGIMVPYLCRDSKSVHSVRLWRVMHSIPSLSEVAEGKRKIGDEKNTDRRLVSHSYCEGRV